MFWGSYPVVAILTVPPGHTGVGVAVISPSTGPTTVIVLHNGLGSAVKGTQSLRPSTHKVYVPGVENEKVLEKEEIGTSSILSAGGCMVPFTVHT